MSTAKPALLDPANDEETVKVTAYRGEVRLETSAGVVIRLSPTSACSLGLRLLDAGAQAMGLVSSYSAD